MKNKKELIVGGSIVAVLLIIGFVFTIKHKKAEAPLANIPTVTAPAAVIPKKHLKVTKIDAPELTYTEAYTKYNNGHLIQFGPNCQSIPVATVLSNGSALMLDNRSNTAEVITIGDNNYALAPYNFSIINLNVAQTPATFSIDCKAGENVHTLVIE